MNSKSESIAHQTLVYLKSMSLLPTIIGWIILITPPFMHRVLPKDWERDLFPWVGIPLEPKIVILLGYAAMFGAVLVLIAGAIYLAKNSKRPVKGETAIGSFATFIVIAAFGAAGLHMIETGRNLLAATLFSLPVIILGFSLWVGKRPN